LADDREHTPRVGECPSSVENAIRARGTAVTIRDKFMHRIGWYDAAASMRPVMIECQEVNERVVDRQ
jgi:hypothetical protein